MVSGSASSNFTLFCRTQSWARRLSVAARLARLPRWGAHGLIRAYQLSLSMLVGRHCRHWPSCSSYTDEAIMRNLADMLACVRGKYFAGYASELLI
jgi:hypothetical protein